MSDLYKYLKYEKPEVFEGIKRFDCIVEVGSMERRLVCRTVSAKCRHGEVVFNTGDWQEVIAWREVE